MKPAKYDIDLYRNRDYSQIFEFDYDISEITFNSSLKLSEDVIDFTTTKIDDYKLQLSLTSAEINSLENKTYRWDLKQTTNGFSTQLIFGNINIISTVTE